MPTDLQDDLVDQAADTIRAHLRDFVRRLRDAGWVDPQEAVALHGKGYREAIDQLSDRDALIQFSWERRGQDTFVDLAEIEFAGDFLESRLSTDTEGMKT